MSRIRTALQAHEKEAIERLVALMRSAAKDSTSLEACKLILAYLYGKPDSVDVDDLSDEELLASIRRRQERAKATPRVVHGLE